MTAVTVSTTPVQHGETNENESVNVTMNVDENVEENPKDLVEGDDSNSDTSTVVSNTLASTLTLNYQNVHGWLKMASNSWFNSWFTFQKKSVFVKLEGFEIAQFASDKDLQALEKFELKADTSVKVSSKVGINTLTLKGSGQNSNIKWVFEDDKMKISNWYNQLDERIQSLREAEGGDSTSSQSSSLTRDTDFESLTTIAEYKRQMVEGVEFLIPNYYKPRRKLGAGAYGIVISAHDTRHSPKKNVGIKKCFSVFNSPLDAKKIAREIHLTKQFDHPNVLSLITVIPPTSESFDDLYIVSELMDIDLHNLMHRRNAALTPEHIKFFVYQLVCAVHYLHSIDVMHRDIKPSNCMINSNCDLRLIDYGLARGFLESEHPDGEFDIQSPQENGKIVKDDYSEYVVTRWYRAPEVILNPRKYDKALDMWAVGCLLAELINRRPLFPARNYEHLLRLITKGCGTLSESELGFINKEKPKEFMRNLPSTPRKDFATIFPNTDPECLDFLDKLLQIDPNKRLTAAQALEHPYFEGFRDLEKEKVGEKRIQWNNLESLVLTNNGNPRQARQRLTKELRNFILHDIVDMNPEAEGLYRNLNSRSSNGI